MTQELRVVGAGLPRTGTKSLRVALELLLGGTCYHMSTLLERGAVDVPVFSAAARSEPVEWSSVFESCTSAVDWPASAFWRDLAEQYPDAVIVLSERDSAETWWESANATVFENNRRQRPYVDDGGPMDQARYAMTEQLLEMTFGPNWDDAAAAKAGYDRWNRNVRESVAAERLVEWRAQDGWRPLCEALALPVPDEPFPHVNTREDFDRRWGPRE